MGIKSGGTSIGETLVDVIIPLESLIIFIIIPQQQQQQQPWRRRSAARQPEEEREGERQP